MAIDELREPRVADAGLCGHGLPIPAPGLQERLDLNVKSFIHSRNLAINCSTVKQQITCFGGHSRWVREKSINQVVADNLLYWMGKRKIATQGELARLAKVSQRTVGNYLNPDLRMKSATGKEPSAKIAELEKIAKVFGVEVWWLLRPFTALEWDAFLAGGNEALAGASQNAILGGAQTQRKRANGK
jgi:hypothetical protein